jgi:hypothetical protein
MPPTHKFAYSLYLVFNSVSLPSSFFFSSIPALSIFSYPQLSILSFPASNCLISPSLFSCILLVKFSTSCYHKSPFFASPYFLSHFVPVHPSILSTHFPTLLDLAGRVLRVPIPCNPHFIKPLVVSTFARHASKACPGQDSFSSQKGRPSEEGCPC